MKQRLNKLLTIKSIVTVVITAVFAVLALKGVIEPREVLSVYLIIIGFYFGTQKIKEDNSGADQD